MSAFSNFVIFRQFSYSFKACTTKPVEFWLVVNHKHYDYRIKHSLNFSECHSTIPIRFWRRNKERKSSLYIHRIVRALLIFFVNIIVLASLVVAIFFIFAYNVNLIELECWQSFFSKLSVNPHSTWPNLTFDLLHF